MRAFWLSVGIISLVGVIAVALVLNSAKNRPKLLQCYTVEYLHVSGSTVVTTLLLTELEKEWLHADQDQGSYFLTVTAPGDLSYRTDVRVNGATALLSITPCQ